MAEQGAQTPGRPARIMNFPTNPGFLSFETFDGIDTKPPRPAIEESKMAWCDGFFPFGQSYIRTLYDVGPGIYTCPNGTVIVAHWFYNLSSTTYAAVLLNNGSLVQVATATGITTQIMSAGTIQNPNPSQTWMTQWNAKYLCIVSDQTNGYWIWDGTNLFTAGGISPEVILTGAGLNYTSAPTVNFQTTGAGAGTAFNAVVTNGSVTSVTVSSSGSGFLVGDFVDAYFTGGGSDNTAHVTPTVSASTGQVTGVVITGSLTNVPASAYITFSGGGGTGATASLIANNGALESILVTNGGGGYTSSPTVAINSDSGAVGTFAAVAEVSYGTITGGTIVDGGTGYTSPPTITIIGDGIGAQATAILDGSGAVSQIVMNNIGYNYTKALFHFSGGNNAASAAVLLMPFGVQGTTIEVYVNRIWIGNKRTGLFTAPSSATNFSPADGAGAFQSNDSFQKVSYIRFLQTNGFLYLTSDSSLNYIGGVQTSASGGVTNTAFNNLNVDPEIGTPWPASHQLFSRNIVFANSFGVFVSYGGAVTKISGPLDGIYYTVPSDGTTVASIYPSSATAAMFGIACYMLLLPVIDSFTNTQVNKLLLWDGKKWFTSNQSKNLTYISSQEINSVLTAWGTDGTTLFPLFQAPSMNFQKVVQSKLWTNPSYWYKKTDPELAGIFNFFTTAGTVEITVDNENGPSDTVTIVAQSTAQLTWTNDSDQSITWTNNSAQPIFWGSVGLALVSPQTVGQVGVMLGITVTTTAPDFAILSISLLDQNYQSLF